MKRLFAMLLALLMSALAPVSEHCECDGFEYRVLYDGTAEITGWSWLADSTAIPSELDGHKVTSIGDKAFKEWYLLTDAVIPDGVTSIGEKAFYGCRCLTRVIVPGSVKSIGEDAFYRCDSLTEVDFSEGLVSIGE